MWKASAITRGMSSPVADQEVVLGDRHRDAGDVGLLEGVGPDQRAPDLPGDRDHRDRVHLRVGQRGDQVGGAGTRSGHADPDLAGGVRVAAGGVAGALLVADQHVAQLLRVEQRVIDRQHRAARNAEDDLDVEFLQRPDHRLRAGKLLRAQHVSVGAGFAAVSRRPRRVPLAGPDAAGRVVGALTVSSSSCPDSLWKFRCWARKNPRQLSCCTRVARWCWIASNAEGLVSHQRAD